MSPRLPIGVATRCRPGASACAGVPARRVAVSVGERRRRRPPAGDCRSDCSRPGLLAGVRWLGSPPPLASRPEAILAALASSAFRLNPCSLSRCCSRSPRAAAGCVPAPLATAAIALCRRETAARPCRDAGPAGALPPPAPGRSRWRAAAAVGAQCRTRQGDARSGAARAVRDRQANRLTLVPRDTAGPPAAPPRRRARRSRDGAQLILGPLLAAEVEAVRADRARGQDQCHRLCDADPGGRRQCLSDGLPAASGSGARGRRSPASAAISRFGALAPNTPYGRLMTDALRDTVGAAGGTVTKVEYSRSANGATPRRRSDALRPVAGPEAKAEFDALLLPLGGDQLKQTARQIKAAGAGADKVQLLGSGLWDDPSTAGEPALYGGWFAASPLGPAARSSRAGSRPLTAARRRGSPRSPSTPPRSPPCWRSASATRSRARRS